VPPGEDGCLVAAVAAGTLGRRSRTTAALLLGVVAGVVVLAAEDDSLEAERLEDPQADDTRTTQAAIATATPLIVGARRSVRAALTAGKCRR
jgi:hypothetical protein